MDILQLGKIIFPKSIWIPDLEGFLMFIFEQIIHLHILQFVSRWIYKKETHKFGALVKGQGYNITLTHISLQEGSGGLCWFSTYKLYRTTAVFEFY